MANRLQDMTWPQIDEYLRRERKSIVVPIGPIEEHGPHLTVTTDIDTALQWADLVAIKVDCLIFPPIPLMCCGISKETNGTYPVQPDTLSAVIADITADLAKKGFNKILFLTGHGGYSMKVMREQAFPIARERVDNSFQVEFQVEVMNFEEAVPEQAQFVGTADELDCHAGGIETSRVLALLGPDYLLSDLPPVDLPSDGPDGKVLSKSGIWGNPQLASLERGKQIIDLAVKRASEWLLA